MKVCVIVLNVSFILIAPFISFAFFLWPTKTFQTSKDYFVDKLNKDLFNRKILTNRLSDIKKQISSEMKIYSIKLKCIKYDLLSIPDWYYLT